MEQIDSTIQRCFERKREIINLEEHYMANHYMHSDTFVKVYGRLPSKYNEKGQCSIYIKGYDINFCLTHKDLLELNAERKTKKLRNIISCKGSHIGYCFLSINSRYIQNIEDYKFEQLLVLLEDYLNEYEQYFDDFENFIGAKEFRRVESDGKDFYILKEIDRKDWKKLLDFANKYDRSNGNSEIFCFHKGMGTMVTATYKEYIKFQLIPGQAESISLASFWHPDNTVQVQWTVPSYKGRKGIREGFVFTAKQSFEWIHQVLACCN